MAININKLTTAIDEWSMNMGEENILIHVPDNSKKQRKHLGLSEIGNECARAAWFSFRKVSATNDFPPNLMRLFQRGHREEFFFVHMLKAIGLSVFEEDPETGKQFKVTDFEGHVSGSMDAVMRDKNKLFGNCAKPFLGEFKTYNDNRFKKLKKDGVKISDIKYFVQMQAYIGYETRLTGALFCAVNKNTDELYFEWVPRCPRTFESIKERAELLLNAKAAPKGISNRKGFWKCKMCNFQKNCFDLAPSDPSCRSCKFAEPAPGAEWKCTAGKTYGNSVIIGRTAMSTKALEAEQSRLQAEFMLDVLVRAAALGMRRDAEIAAAAGLSTSYLSMIVSGKRPLSLMSAFALARVFNCSVTLQLIPNSDEDEA